MCAISYDTIELTDEYCRCLTCKNIYKADVLITWLMNGERNKTCPMCRTFWPKSNHIKYCNK